MKKVYWLYLFVVLIAIFGADFVSISAKPVVEKPDLKGSDDKLEPLYGRKVIDLSGKIHTLGAGRPALPSVVVFLGIDCPISRRSIISLNDVAKVAKQGGGHLHRSG
ncbi:MAG: hypothetical protein L3J39_02865 [Verrucomicrobiales bacterium]|nr:hypothetical protein [Verrucomicrobiales bacterium]